jgi:hypothetical protein
MFLEYLKDICIFKLSETEEQYIQFNNKFKNITQAKWYKKINSENYFKKIKRCKIILKKYFLIILFFKI